MKYHTQKVIHENFNNFSIINKYGIHASLKSCRSITQTEWHSSVGKSTKWAGRVVFSSLSLCTRI
jgi:hypothetical protein